MVVDAEELEQLIETMEDSVIKLEKAISKKKEKKINELRALIYDLHLKIKEELKK